MKDKIIPFNGPSRLLAKARAYISAPSEMLQEADQAVALLFRAVKVADEELKLKIVLMLGTLARPQVVWPLYKLMHDFEQSESVRHAAAIQLSVIGSMLENNTTLVEQLIEDLRCDDPFVRANAAFALGWEGNRRAVIALIERLHDKDPEVQQAAVNALANLHDDRIFKLLVERLDSGDQEQKRSILYNLYRFSSHKAQVIEIYKSHIRGRDNTLRYDALAIFEAVANPADHLDIYGYCLQKGDARMRELALIRLLATKSRRLETMRPLVRPLLRDDDPRVRQAAIRLYNYINPSDVLCRD